LGRQILIAVAGHGLSPYLGIKNEVFFFSLLDFSMVLDSAQISGCYQPMSKSGLAPSKKKKRNPTFQNIRAEQTSPTKISRRSRQS